MSQKSFPGSRFDSLFYEHDAACDVPCEVRMGDGHIEVSYEDEGKTMHYIGFERSEGHFELRCPEIAGKASLHMFANAREMAGYWIEGKLHGMWRIKLAQ